MTAIWPAISAQMSRYDAWLCDIWGVLHNGVSAYRAAADACAEFRQHGGRVILLSNAPRPAAAVAAQLADMDITASSYDGILTSGDVTRALLSAMDPVPLFLLGPDRHRVLIEGLTNPFVSETDAAMVLCSGLFETADDDHPDQYRPQLARLAKRRLRMICANPDLAAQAGDVIRYAAGALAAIYEQLGGNVLYAGKPHAAVYAEARARLAARPHSRHWRWGQHRHSRRGRRWHRCAVYCEPDPPG
jgi:HAD superfamily hydrolase (TIGR01459 family)